MTLENRDFAILLNFVFRCFFINKDEAVIPLAHCTVHGTYDVATLIRSTDLVSVDIDPNSKPCRSCGCLIFFRVYFFPVMSNAHLAQLLKCF